jgi:hypothetical protein
MNLAIEILQQSLIITAFVGVMLILVEYLNVQTQGMFLRALPGSRWRQYLLAVMLGAIPGCLGAYVVVALYAHRKVTVGSTVAAMIATSGDETFVMLGLFPAVTAWMTAGMVVIGVLAGWATDRFVPDPLARVGDEYDTFTTHAEDACRCFPRGRILSQWRPPSVRRSALVFGLLLMVIALLSGKVGPPLWSWSHITLLVVMGIGIFIAATVPDHFLREHLWEHVAIRHVPGIFLWIIGVLAVLHVVERLVDLPSLISTNRWAVLFLAGAVGILPESGPHLIFVKMYADGLIPISILLASSVVQDGHGMLPLLSVSKRAFVVIKLVNLVVGLAAGAALLALGG